MVGTRCGSAPRPAVPAGPAGLCAADADVKESEKMEKENEGMKTKWDY